MITNKQGTRYSYRSRLMALPVLALVFCSIALYAQRSANSVTTIFHPEPSSKAITVVIDAGHGGSDNGAVSADGKYLEKDLALQISQKIQQLASSYNINVVMTRTDDNLPGNATTINDGLKARTALAQQKNADLFVAIHVSATGEPTTTQSGFEVYVSNKNDDKNTQLSKQLGTVVLQELSKVYQTNATLLQRQNKGIWVLEQSPCPAVLIECGFITNDKDAAFFSNSSNQEAVAKKILEGIVNYKNKPAAAVSTPATASQPVAQTAQVEKPVTHTTVTPMASPAQAGQALADPTAPVDMRIDLDLQENPLIKKLTAFYCRNTRYPQQALAQQAEGVVYFSIALDPNGGLNSFQVYDQAPVATTQLNKISINSIANPNEVATAEQLSKEEIIKLLQDEMKRASTRKIDLTGFASQNAQYYFQVTFRLEKRQTPTV